MRKIKLYGIGNEGKFNHYTFEKTKHCQEVLSKLFYETLKILWSSNREYQDDGGNWVVEDINIENYKDSHEMIHGLKMKNQRIDIFYGDRKMFIILNCTLARRRKFHDRLQKIVEMPELNKLKKEISIKSNKKSSKK